MNKTRDIRFDIIKAIAIILVFFGHIFQESFLEYENNPLFRLIWAIQMPLFMFVSGYFVVGNTGKPKILAAIKKRAIAYIIPFFSYYYIIKFLILGVYNRNLVVATKKLAFSLENGLWFLWVVFVLSVIFIISDFFYGKFKNEFARLGAVGISIFVLLLPFLIIGAKISLSFLGAKYILYYTIFFGLGYITRKYKKLVAKFARNEKLRNTVFSISLFVLSYMVFNVNLFQKNDSIVNILFRIISGLCGISVIGCMCFNLKKDSNSKIQALLLTLGENTLEIYYAHMIVVTKLIKQDIPMFSAEGFWLCILNASITSIVTFALIKIIKSNKSTNFIMFGKKCGAKKN